MATEVTTSQILDVPWDSGLWNIGDGIGLGDCKAVDTAILDRFLVAAESVPGKIRVTL